MAFGDRRTIFGATVAVVVCVIGFVSAAAQGGQAQTAQTSETVFKDVRVLRGMPVDEFMDAMGMFSASLGYDCASCHSADIHSTRDAFAITTPKITKARAMIAMMNAINRANFGGVQRVTCFTCHRGNYTPEIVPSLAQQYGTLTDDPSAMQIFPDRQVTANQVFDKYLQALGGADRLARLTSLVGKGTYVGFNTGGGEVPVEIFAKAPDLRAQIVHMPDGDSIKTFDGRNGWAAEAWRPVPLMALTGGNLTGAKVDAAMSFPAGIRQAFRQWQASSTIIDDRPVQILQGTNAGELPVNLYFDASGLLIRLVRWNRTTVGTVPTQIDYSDYREVAGVKTPFRSVMTWTDGQSTIALSEVQPNVSIDATRFARPAPFQPRRP